jgi:hypothetical protein
MNEKDFVLEGFFEDLAETYWINQWILKIINNITEKQNFIALVNSFEKACIEAGWIKVDDYKAALEEKLKDVQNLKAMTAEEIMNKNFEISSIKFACLLGLLKVQKVLKELSLWCEVWD